MQMWSNSFRSAAAALLLFMNEVGVKAPTLHGGNVRPYSRRDSTTRQQL